MCTVGPSSLVPDHAVPSRVGYHCGPVLPWLGFVHHADPHANLLRAGPWTLNGQCEVESNIFAIGYKCKAQPYGRQDSFPICAIFHSSVNSKFKFKFKNFTNSTQLIKCFSLIYKCQHSSLNFKNFINMHAVPHDILALFRTSSSRHYLSKEKHSTCNSTSKAVPTFIVYTRVFPFLLYVNSCSKCLCLQASN